MFYKQLLHLQIQKEQKRQSSYQCIFALLGSVHLKAARKPLMKLTPVCAGKRTWQNSILVVTKYFIPKIML